MLFRSLRLQVERLRQSAQRNMRSARHRNAYHDAQRAYDSFQEEQLAFEEQSSDDLKGVYRQASKHCHPDVVPEAYREQAAATFQALEAAYEAGHSRAVHAIAEAPEKWGFPGRSASSCGEHEQAFGEVALRQAVSSLEASISALHRTEVYQAVADVEDLDALLVARKRELLRRLQALKRR